MKSIVTIDSLRLKRRRLFAINKAYRKLIGIVLSAVLLLQAADCLAGFFLFDKGAYCEAAAKRSGFCKELVKTDDFTLLAYSRITKSGAPLVIYIEGDGSAWDSNARLSDDPTPRDPVVINLAAADPAPNVAYLARPGQYSMEGASEASPAYWSNARFSETVVRSMDQAVEYLKLKYGAQNISLVGYSGGGALAVLIAARRGDVASLRTVAGNLDHQAVNKYHGVSPLAGSLNPIDYAPQVAKIPQRHFVGGNDKVVPAFIARSFAAKAGDRDDKRITVVDGASHTEGWQERWPELLAIPVD